jgi:ribonucleoside-triphosphate reductase
VLELTGKDLLSEEGQELGLKILEYMNKKCDDWNAELNLGFGIYGTPLESTTYKFARCLQKRYGEIPGVTDNNYITNSYHIHVETPVDPFTKLAVESKFQRLSKGGAISYIESVNLENNIEAALSVIQYIYDNIMYAEINTKSDYCQKCGWDQEIKIVEDDSGKLVWECPNCKNRDQSTMNVARRTCGYIGTQYFNQGRTAEIKDRYVHLGGNE